MSIQPMRDVDAGTAAGIAVQPETLVLDVRTEEEYAKGRIKGAILIPLADLESRKTNLLPADKNKPILVYCQTGRRSAKASAALAQRGYTNIHHLLGGLDAWQKAGQPVVK